MSAGEFGRWLAFFEEEPIGCGSQLELWAQLMASINTGPIFKKGGWLAKDFAKPMWAPPQPEPPAQAKKPTTITDLRAHVKALKPIVVR